MLTLLGSGPNRRAPSAQHLGGSRRTRLTAHVRAKLHMPTRPREARRRKTAQQIERWLLSGMKRAAWQRVKDAPRRIRHRRLPRQERREGLPGSGWLACQSRGPGRGIGSNPCSSSAMNSGRQSASRAHGPDPVRPSWRHNHSSRRPAAALVPGGADPRAAPTACAPGTSRGA